jgi:RhtX/FptX family siderophore transporter
MREGSREKMLLIASLYVSQAIPLGFFVVALPAILRQRGTSLETVSLFSALALPWLIKFLWAPLVDRYGSPHGHYRSWILPLQLLSVIAVASLAWANPERNLAMLAIVGGVFMLCAATQDIATDGLAVRVLREDERGIGNGIQVGGYYLGQILGGGIVLILFDRFGWVGAMIGMAIFLSIPLLPAFRFDEPAASVAHRAGKVRFSAIGAFFRRPGAFGWVVLLLLYRSGDAMAMTMLNPMLVDLGLSLKVIGVMTGVAFSIGALAGSLTGGWLTGVLGRRVSLSLFACLHAVALSGYLLPANGLVRIGWIYGLVLFVAVAGGLATAALYTCMMDRSDPTTAATDFTLQQSLCAVGPVIGAVLSGSLAAKFGYSTLFAAFVGLSLLAAGLAARQTGAVRVALTESPQESTSNS